MKHALGEYGEIPLNRLHADEMESFLELIQW